MEKKVFLLIVVVSLVLFFISLNIGVVNAKDFKVDNAKSFEVDNVLIKFLIKQGNSLTKEIKIINKDRVQNFKISSDLEFVEIKEKEFSLNPGESRKIELIFHGNRGYNVNPGVYPGNLIIKGEEEKRIPIILEIESKEVLFDLSMNVPLEYSTVEKGGKMIIENRIINLENLGMKTVEIEYFIKDFDGNTIFSDVENLAVETQISITKIFPIPLNIKEGDYVFGVIITYKDSVGTNTYFFKINEKQKQENNFNYLWIMFGVAILLVGGLFFYSIKQRNDLLLKLEKQHKEELRMYVGKIKKKETNELKRAKPAEKKKIKKKFKKIKKIIKKQVKKKQKTQRREFKKLKKKKRKSEMQKKLEVWKKEGYNINEFLINIEKSSKKKSNKNVKEYKRQGYKM